MITPLETGTTHNCRHPCTGGPGTTHNYRNPCTGGRLWPPHLRHPKTSFWRMTDLLIENSFTGIEHLLVVKYPLVWAALSRSGRTAGRPRPASQELFLR
jgi:hypothetical protein